MITRILYPEEKAQYNKVVTHPLHSWEWGDFQIGEGHKVYRLGMFENDKMVGGYTVSFHKIPHTEYSIGTILRGPKVDQDMIDNVRRIARDEKAIFVKFEPDVWQKTFDANNNPSSFDVDMDFEGLQISPKVAFYPYSYVVDLTKTEDELLAQMHSKTRYNIKIANRHGVTFTRDSEDKSFEIYLKLLFETTKRQGFYLHSMDYHRHLWKVMKPTGMVSIFIAYYEGKPLSSFMIYAHNNRLYYPYGASSDTNRQVMAPTLLMWEVIKYGKSLGLKSFDMWGSLGPDAKESEQGFGFHRFKQGYGGQLVQFVGTYDLVLNPQLYKLYNFIDSYRWKLLRLKAKILR